MDGMNMLAEANKFRIKFTDGKEIAIWDDGQSCCEERYMMTDDKPGELEGGTFVKIDVKEVPDLEKEYGMHECCFVEIVTDKCTVVLVNHNEHNGYYGGFGLTITEPGDRGHD